MLQGKTGAWEEAIAVLDALEAQGIEPEIRTYNTGAPGPARAAESGHRGGRRHLLCPGRMSSPLCMPRSVSPWQLPCSVLTRCLHRPHPLPCAVIIACNMSGQAQEALRIYERMLQAGAQPTATTYTALISAYGKNGQLDKALDAYAKVSSGQP